MLNLMKSGLVEADDKRLAEKIEKKFLVDEYQTEDRKLRLKPIKDDCVSFDKLITNDPTEFVESSNITQNYYYFENRIKKNEISIDDFDCQTPKREKIIFCFYYIRTAGKACFFSC